jgi:hypothetical protein
MGHHNQMEAEQAAQEESLDADLLGSVLPTVAVGELIAITNNGRTPLVLYPGQPGSAGVPARSIVDLRGAHVGKRVALLFEGADITRPIVAGVLRDSEGWPLTDEPGQVEVDADGDRLVVSAKTQLVLRCGRASITLTKEGKILIQGTYVSSRSSGVHRIKGGSVQIN